MKNITRRYISELPSALFMATVTAFVTLALAIILSWTLGAESRNQRLADRCTGAYIADLLHDIVEASSTLSEGIDISDYPPLYTRDLDCSIIFEPLPDE